MALEGRPGCFTGPRQAGKTILARVACEPRGYSYCSFDDPVLADTAKADPVGFVAHLPDLVILDEVQRVPEIFVPLKQSVDNDRRPGRFLLTGSADVVMLPALSDALADRMHIVLLLPIAQCELARQPNRFLDALWKADFDSLQTGRVGRELAERFVAGGFPAALARSSPNRRAAWYRDYQQTVVARVVRDMSRIRSLDVLPRLLSTAATQSARLFNLSNLASPFNRSRPTIREYITILERLFLIEELPAWHSNRRSRLIKTPKLHFGDTGLTRAQLGANADALMANRVLFGQWLETFVDQELRRQAMGSEDDMRFYHFRHKDGADDDVVIERGAFQPAGVEVKVGSTVRHDDFRGLQKLVRVSGSRFVCGVVLYDGSNVIRFGKFFCRAAIRALELTHGGPDTAFLMAGICNRYVKTRDEWPFLWLPSSS